MRVILIGFMASGKTTLGKVLATELSMDFYDLDDLVAEKSGQTIKQIFAKEGEDKFRQIEQEALEEVLQKENIVLSTGGGAPCYGDNMDKILEAGFVIYLKMPVEPLTIRMMDSKIERPLIWGKSPIELREYVSVKLIEREPFYRRAHQIIDAENIKLKELAELINKEK